MTELYAYPVPTGTPHGLRVLVVDDSPELRDSVKGALERAGLTVVGEAADGVQALAQAAAQRPDVVLMDLRMPRMDGIVATRALRVQQPGTPVVLWTGDGDVQLDGAVREAGAYAGLSKGVRLTELVATLRRTCASTPIECPASHAAATQPYRALPCATSTAIAQSPQDGTLDRRAGRDADPR